MVLYEHINNTINYYNATDLVCFCDTTQLYFNNDNILFIESCLFPLRSNTMISC